MDKIRLACQWLVACFMPCVKPLLLIPSEAWNALRGLGAPETAKKG